MKRAILVVVLAAVACAPGQSTTSATAPTTAAASTGGVSTLGKTPTPVGGTCPIASALAEYPVCSHVHVCSDPGPLGSSIIPEDHLCCQVCAGGTWLLRCAGPEPR